MFWFICRVCVCVYNHTHCESDRAEQQHDGVQQPSTVYHHLNKREETRLKHFPKMNRSEGSW